MRKKSANSAQSVLNDDYGEEQKLFPHDRLLEYWRQVFSRESVRDDRRITPIMGVTSLLRLGGSNNVRIFFLIFFLVHLPCIMHNT